MTTRTLAIGGLLLALLAIAPAAAQDTCEVSGVVVDGQGNPVPEVKIKFTPVAGGGTPYEAKTNKKGRYFVSGMFNPSNEGLWAVELSAEGYAPVRMEVESRNAQRVLMGEIRPLTLKPGAKIPDIMVRPLGNARVDFTLATSDEVAAAAPAAAGAKQPAAAPAPDSWETALGRVSAGDLEGSIEFFEKAIADRPEESERRESLAKVYYRLERYDEAEKRALEAIELAPQSTSSRMVLYTVYVGRGDLERAETVVREARELAPEDPNILRQVAYVAAESGDPAAAIEAYESLVRVDPADSQSWLALAALYARQGDMSKSEKAYEKVVELNPREAPQVFFNLGALIMNKEDRDADDTQRAIASFRKAIELKPDYREAHKQLAFALLGTGDQAGAKTELEACLRLAPDAPDASQVNALIDSLR